MTRQLKRQAARAEKKIALRNAKISGRKDAHRALLERQTARERAGAYAGRSVGSAIAQSRSRITKRKVKKGNAFCRIIKVYFVGGQEVSYHATKGWRSHRVA